VLRRPSSITEPPTETLLSYLAPKQIATASRRALRSDVHGMDGQEQPRATQSSSPSSSPASLYLIIYGVAKKHNIGNILRCAAAFNVKAVCLVGSRKFNSFGAHGSEVYVPMLYFEDLDTCCKALKEEHGVVDILGIEIDDSALPVHRHPFRGNTALMMGEEGHGMNEKQLKLCDGLVYVSQYGAGTASLNVCVATSIVLHQFALWAGYPERARQAQKYVVGERPQRNAPRGVVPYTERELEELRARRAEKKKKLGIEADVGAGTGA
jgi:tRNA G18 (ribose-2'-O)-methylase SpoU